jgi:septum formation protein
LIKAYVENGEGIDRAGGFAVQVRLFSYACYCQTQRLTTATMSRITQGLGGFLVKSIQGDYNNVVGFPSSPFWRWMGELYEDGVFSD